jgi:NAD(P)-dependent dehydrogenase (short-subunit alcohol dehydrogenase family)
MAGVAQQVAQRFPFYGALASLPGSTRAGPEVNGLAALGLAFSLLAFQVVGPKLALPGMLEHGCGHIVNVGSYLGEVPAAGLASYCASKHAVIGFSESLRDELAGTGVTITGTVGGCS